MLAMKFFFLFLHSLVKTWPYYRSQAPAHHCCHNLIRERTLILSVIMFLNSISQAELEGRYPVTSKDILKKVK